MLCYCRGTAIPHEIAASYNCACLVHRKGEGALHHYHSTTHPLAKPVLDNLIRIADPDMPQWQLQLVEALGKASLVDLRQLLIEAWDSLQVDEVLSSSHNTTH